MSALIEATSALVSVRPGAVAGATVGVAAVVALLAFDGGVEGALAGGAVVAFGN